MGEDEQRQRRRDDENQRGSLEHSIAVVGGERKGGGFEYFIYPLNA